MNSQKFQFDLFEKHLFPQELELRDSFVLFIFLNVLFHAHIAQLILVILALNLLAFSKESFSQLLKTGSIY